MEHDLFDDLAARAHGVHVQRLPSVGLFASPLTVRYLFDIPRSGYYQGRQMDVKRVVLAAMADSAQARLAFMNQAGMQGSYFEGSVFDQLFSRPQGKSISAAQLLMDANQQAIPIYRINQANLDAVLPQLAVSTAVRTDIINAVQAGRIALVPQRELTHGTWSGSGYILQDPQSGAAAYLIEGGANGGLEGECGTQLSPQAAQQISLIAAAILTAMLQGPLSGAGGAAVAAYLSYFVVAGAGSAAATAAAIIAPLVIAVVLVTVLLLVAMLIHLALLEMSLVAASDAPDCECIPEPKPQACECTYRQLPHLGGNGRSDVCADSMPNRFPGSDTEICTPQRLCRTYDTALVDGNTYCEVKVYNFDRNEFLISRTDLLTKDARQASVQRNIAAQCGFNYCYVVADPRHVPLVAAWGVSDIRLREDCLQLP